MNPMQIHACGRDFTPRGYSQHISRSPSTHCCIINTELELAMRATQDRMAPQPGSLPPFNHNVACDLSEGFTGGESNPIGNDHSESGRFVCDGTNTTNILTFQILLTPRSLMVPPPTMQIVHLLSTFVTWIVQTPRISLTRLTL